MNQAPDEITISEAQSLSEFSSKITRTIIMSNVLGSIGIDDNSQTHSVVGGDSQGDTQMLSHNLKVPIK